MASRDSPGCPAQLVGRLTAAALHCLDALRNCSAGLHLLNLLTNVTAIRVLLLCVLKNSLHCGGDPLYGFVNGFLQSWVCNLCALLLHECCVTSLTLRHF